MAFDFNTTLHGIEADSFGHKQLFPFMKIEILRSALTELDQQRFLASSPCRRYNLEAWEMSHARQSGSQWLWSYLE
jgi:hypothetical protein